MALWQLGRLPLLDVDEPVYGEVGKEMAHAGLAGWLTPHYNGSLWFDKPPLFYWLTALSMRLFGVSEFSARLPSALLGIGLVAVTVALARRAFPENPQAGWWAGFVLATSAQFFLLARAAVTDMTLAFTLTAALLSVYAWITTGRGRWMAAAGVMTGLAALDKGPVALVLIGLQVIVFLASTRQAKRLRDPALWGGFALCLLVALPWYLLMIHWHGSAFIQGFLEANNATRFLKAEHKETQNVLFYVPVFCGFFLPWTLALPGTIAATARTIKTERREPDSPQPVLFLTLWCALVFLFFSASQTKLVTYIFPLFPAAAILVGKMLVRPIQVKVAKQIVIVAIIVLLLGITVLCLSHASKVAVALMATSFLTLLIILCLWRLEYAFSLLLFILDVALIVIGHKYSVAPVTIGLWTAVLLTGAVMSAILPPMRGRWTVPGAALGLMLLIAWSSPTWKTQAATVSDRDAARIMAQAAPAGDTLYALGMKHPSLVFYSDRRVLYSDDRAAAIRDMTAHPEHVYAVGAKVLNELHDNYDFWDYHVLYQNKHLTVIQSGPGRGNK